MGLAVLGTGEVRRDGLPEGLAVSAFGGKTREDVVHVVRVEKGAVDDVTFACRMDRHGRVDKRVGAHVIVGRTDWRVDERVVAGKGWLAAAKMVTEGSLSQSPIVVVIATATFTRVMLLLLPPLLLMLLLLLVLLLLPVLML